MQVFRHKSHTVYQLKKKIVFIKENSRTQFYAKFIGFINWRFIIKRNFWLIRTPFFFLEKNNGGISIGLPNCYLWFIK